MRKAHDNKRDANELEIVKALEAFGAVVTRRDDYDLDVEYQGVNTKLEIKNPNTDWRLTPAQRKMFNENTGSPIHIITNSLQALYVIKRSAIK
jgi:hypothetical protein